MHLLVDVTGLVGIALTTAPTGQKGTTIDQISIRYSILYRRGAQTRPRDLAPRDVPSQSKWGNFIGTNLSPIDSKGSSSGLRVPLSVGSKTVGFSIVVVV